MKRGELWTVAGGVYATKPRPALIIQDDRYDGTAYITVLPLTTTPVDAPLLRLPVHPSASTGVWETSYVMIDSSRQLGEAIFKGLSYGLLQRSCSRLSVHCSRFSA
jgi:mRNA-degrading endonuclease toxin of MazEF toxin-antitoxin module